MNLGTRNVSLSFSRRQWLMGLALLGLLFILALEFQSVLPAALERWNSFDYWRYTEIGRALRANPYSYGNVALDSVYPLPAELWLFVPLSFLPDWFRIVWVMVPILSLIVLFRRDAVLWAAFPPLWYVIGDGTIDGLLILPLYWLVQNRPVLGALGALALLVKPQLVALPLAYMLIVWLVTRDWRQLGIFAGGAVFFALPAFILDPLWILHMWQSLYARSDEMAVANAPISSSMWGWLEYGTFGIIAVILFAIVLIGLLARVLRQRSLRGSALALLDLILFWVLYASSLVLTASALRDTRAVVLVVLAGLAALALDRIAGLGVAYSLIPLVALYALGRDAPELDSIHHEAHR